MPVGSDFQLRFQVTWESGDYYMYYDNVSALQIADSPPNCDAVLTSPVNGATSVPLENTVLAWSGATGIPTSYNLTIATTSGGNDVLDNVNVGNTTSYDLGNLNYETNYYVTIVPENNFGEATDCTIYSFTTEIDPSVTVICSEGSVNHSICYDSNEQVEYVYTSDDNSNLNLVINSGSVYDFGPNLSILDTNGDVLYFGVGDAGNLSGLEFQSTGESITLIYNAEYASCGATYDAIDVTVSCSSCLNPAANFSVVEDCINGPQFKVDVDITTLGSANEVLIEDNQGNSQLVDGTGIYTFGPYQNGTLVDFIVTNNEDSTCDFVSDSFTQEICTANYLDCGDPVNTIACYEPGETIEYFYESLDGSNLTLSINSGDIDPYGEPFQVIDTNGDVLYSGNGELGDLSDLTFQSSGDSITFLYTSVYYNCDGIVTSQLDITVECASCYNPTLDYEIINDCSDGTNQFTVEVEVLDLGSSNSITITDNQNSTAQTVNELGLITFGPYPNETGVVFTSVNDDDSSCTISSQSLSPEPCPPSNNSCANATQVNVNLDQFCSSMTSGDISTATGSTIPVSCDEDVVQDVWYKFTAQSSAHIITLFNGVYTFNLAHAIYEGECDNLTKLYCSKEFSNGGNSDGIVANNLTIGETYYIRVYSPYGSTGEFDLCINTPNYEQGNTTCEDAAPFCASFDSQGNPVPLVFANGYYYMQESVAQESADYSCLSTRPNPAWYYLQVGETGDMEFEISQNTAFDGDGNLIGEELDVDYIVYGPFDQADGNCQDLTEDNTIDCSYSLDAVEQMSIENAQAGKTYLVLITNYNQSPGYISLVQTNYGTADGSSTDCTIVDRTLYGCEGEQITLTSQFENQISYVWYQLNESTGNYDLIPQQEVSGTTYTVDEEGDFRIVSYDSTGTPTEEEFKVQFSPYPIINLGDDQSLCDANSSTLDATPTNAN
ncbi:fibronectin type III domain-containing protein [Mesonia aestuariivivens]|uniref:Fibronectin type III domain-containing protein n=1 Tax=Mesonia aestuariivivens TaxID=2796128 RepID=A0ABS6VZL1_9FLAO|nr:fibronectin type III domain-containing protein [Mesonia aestuariivivens]MBW2960299.1 fibronectin type III domain-containing protein [Mesonia aestuariivivens]